MRIYHDNYYLKSECFAPQDLYIYSEKYLHFLFFLLVLGFIAYETFHLVSVCHLQMQMLREGALHLNPTSSYHREVEMNHKNFIFCFLPLSNGRGNINCLDVCLEGGVARKVLRK